VPPEDRNRKAEAAEAGGRHNAPSLDISARHTMIVSVDCIVLCGGCAGVCLSLWRSGEAHDAVLPVGRLQPPVDVAAASGLRAVQNTVGRDVCKCCNESSERPCETATHYSLIVQELTEPSHIDRFGIGHVAISSFSVFSRSK